MTRLTDDGQVEFRFYRPNATDVRIAGDFNKWCRNSMTMRHEGSGWWTVTATIDSGDHRFRYYADGQWFTDYAANGVEQSKLGWNSILTVPGDEDVQAQPKELTKRKQNKVKLVA